MPGVAMREALARDYAALAGMVLGDIPRFEEVLNSAERVERIINDAAPIAMIKQGRIDR